MKFPKLKMPVIGMDILSFESTRDAEVFVRTDRLIRTEALEDGRILEQYVESGQLYRKVACTALLPQIIRQKLPRPTETGILSLDEVVARASALTID